MAEKLHAAKLAIGISRYGCSQIMRFSQPEDWDKVAVARLGIDPDQFVPAPRADASDPFRVICVGRLVLREGVSIPHRRDRGTDPSWPRRETHHRRRRPRKTTSQIDRRRS